MIDIGITHHKDGTVSIRMPKHEAKHMAFAWYLGISKIFNPDTSATPALDRDIRKSTHEAASRIYVECGGETVHFHDEPEYLENFSL